MDAPTFLFIFQSLLTLLVFTIGAVVKRAAHDLKEVERDAVAVSLRLVEYQRHVSETYATKSDLNSVRIETNNSLHRLHERLDKMDENFDAKMNEVGRDIKVLLLEKKGD